MGTIHNLCNEPDQTTTGSRKVSRNFCAFFKLAKILPEKIFSATKRSFIAKICRFVELENQQTLTNPYGYSGILYKKGTTVELIERAVCLFNEEAGFNSFISSFIRLNPIYNDFIIENTNNFRQIHQGTTSSVNLKESIYEIRKSYSCNHKRNLKRLRSEGFFGKINCLNGFHEFYNLYTQTMARNNAAKHYFFTQDYFFSLFKVFKKSLLLVSVYDKLGNIASSGLFSIKNGIGQFLYGGTSNLHVKLSPSKLVIDLAIETMKKEGANLLHLGGGLGAEKDGLFRFKNGFGNQLHSYNTMRIIHNPDIYNNLICKNKSNNLSQENHFPVYREI